MASNMNDSILTDASATHYKEQYENEEEDFDVFGFYVEGLTLTLVCVFGLIGNSLSIVVLFQPAFRSSFSNFLRGLALCDALFLATAALALGAPQLSGRGSFYREKMFAPAAPMAFGLLHTFRVGSVYATVAVTIERFLAVVFPLRDFPRKKFILPAALLLSVVYNLPKYFEVEMLPDPSTGYLEVHATRLRSNPTYIALYVVWSKFVCTELIPYLTVLILNLIIVVRTVGAAAFRRQHGNFGMSTRSGTCRRREEYEIKGSTVINVTDDDAASSVFPARCGSTRSTASTSLAVVNHNSNGNGQLQHHHRHESSRRLTVPRTSDGQHGGRSDQQGEQGEDEEYQRLRHTSSCSSNGGMPKRQHSFLRRFKSTRSTISQNQHNSNSNNNNSLVRVLIGISVLFIACQSLKTIPDVYEMLFCSASDRQNCEEPPLWIHPLVKLSHLLVCLNSAANFLLYLLHGARFRRAFTETFLCGKKLNSSEARRNSHSHV